MKPPTPRLAPLLVLAALLPGCAELQRVAAGAFEKPRLTVVDGRVESIDLDGATVAVDLKLENPNAIGLTLAGARYRLEVEGEEVVHGQLEQRLELPAHGSAPLTVTARLRWSELPRLLERLRGQVEAAYRISGAVDVETPLGPLDLALSHAGRLPVPRLPEVRLTGAQLRAVSLAELELELSLTVTNPNRFPLAGGRLHFDVLVNDVVVAEGREVAVGGVSAHGEAPVTLPLRLSLRSAGKVAGSLHGGAEVRLRGAATVAGVTTPFETRVRLGGE